MSSICICPSLTKRINFQPEVEEEEEPTFDFFFCSLGLTTRWGQANRGQVTDEVLVSVGRLAVVVVVVVVVCRTCEHAA